MPITATGTPELEKERMEGPVCQCAEAISARSVTFEFGAKTVETLSRDAPEQARERHRVVEMMRITYRVGIRVPREQRLLSAQWLGGKQKKLRLFAARRRVHESASALGGAHVEAHPRDFACLCRHRARQHDAAGTTRIIHRICPGAAPPGRAHGAARAILFDLVHAG
jgi:hypothetical protein